MKDRRGRPLERVGPLNHSKKKSFALCRRVSWCCLLSVSVLAVMAHVNYLHLYFFTQILPLRLEHVVVPQKHDNLFPNYEISEHEDDSEVVIPPELEPFVRLMDDSIFLNTYEKDGLFVMTGDIPDMWIRDSSAQVWPFRDSHPKFVWRVLLQQARFILSDVYANAYSKEYRQVKHIGARDFKLGRGRWVATRNYELDSGCYYLRLLYHMWKNHNQNTDDALRSHRIDLEMYLHERVVSLLVETWTIEQQHDLLSQYTYPELARSGKGPLANFTGMTWSGFRPSDDPCIYSYHIPSNFFVVEVLDYIMEIWGGSELVSESSSWHVNKYLVSKAAQLQQEIKMGIERFGIQNGMYCYEVDGLGNCNMMDDANVPSLLSIPYLTSQQHYDKAIWQKTYSWIWSRENPYFYEGKVASGIGSPHTKKGSIWPMSIIMRGIVDPDVRDSMIEMVNRTKSLNEPNSGFGLFSRRSRNEFINEISGMISELHESFNKDDQNDYSRKWFGWVMALYQELLSLQENS